MLGFTAELPGMRGIPASSVPGEQLSGSSVCPGRLHPCQCISGLAARGGGRSRFMKSAGRSQLPLAKSRPDRTGARLPGTGQSCRLGACRQVVLRSPQPQPIHELDVTAAWLGAELREPCCSGETSLGQRLVEL